MNEWANRVLANGPLNRIKETRVLVAKTEPKPDEPAEISADVERLIHVIGTLEDRFQIVDALLLFPGPMPAFESHLQSIQSEVSAFQSNRNRGHLSNANTQADSLLAVAAQLGIPLATSSPIDSKAVEHTREQADKVLRSIRASERQLQQQVGKLNESVGSTIVEVTTQKSRLDTAIAEYQQQFSAAEGSRQQQAADALKTHAQRLDQAITDAQKRLQDATQDVSRRLDSTLQEAVSRADEQRKQLEDEANDAVDALETMRGKAENLLHVIGSTGMAGEYQKAANTAGALTRWWQIGAALSMLGLILFAILAFVATQGEDINWGGVGARVFVAVAFGILAAYCARQGDRYSDQEVANRRFQLEFSSIDPYVANLPADVQHKLKVELGQRLFGNASMTPSTTDRRTTGTGKDPLEMALSIIGEFIKKRN